MNSQTSTSTQTQTSSAIFGLVTLTSLFFMWGFITSMNDVLIPHLKGVFDLNYTQAMLVQFCFFSAYFLISIPAGKLVSAVGFQKGISIGLATACVGCMLFIPAANVQEYWLFLSALFVLASGITLLQVAANPLVTLMGNPNTASSRLTMTQAFNSLGATLGPVIGGYMLFAGGSHGVGDVSVDTVILPYAILATTLLVLAFVFFTLDLGDTHHRAEPDSHSKPRLLDLMKHRHLMLGALAIFVYVGAEVSIGSFIINFLGESNIANMAESDAANYIAYYWGGALVGRFIGAAMMQRVSASALLATNAVASVVLLSVVVFGSGTLAMWSLILVGLCNSIMFPTIFSLALHGLGRQTSDASGLLCLAIVGGAIIPLMQGVLADSLNLQVSFLLPLICYMYIAFYGFSGSRPMARHD